ncbi:ankyrin repeat domain-containing protein 26-like isoform X4 [Rattus norvegicus]|uniref:ankyrin repeat domain-containing protein 26-like isoform X4 n=1 Tax=Rattus norvegicus TaxID=10116 RepID=UPI00191732AF|nr:ankyrin repeat domain-containing protein 26-like isoform X4 [Rattus norvegicus]
MKKLCCWNQRQSSSDSSTSQRESFPVPGRPCWSTTSLCSLRQLRNYKAFGKIHKAALVGDVATVQRRLRLGKNGTNDRDRNDRTILHYACAHGHPQVVALLLKWNCDIDLRDSDNSTALIKASQYEQEECLAILLEHGADPNAMDNSGNTALHYAVWHNNTSMATKLLAHHADINIRNEDSFTPVILALIKNNENLAKFLEDQRKKIQEPDELDRSSKKTSNEKDKVKEEENRMFELNELISSSERNSEDCEMFSHDTILQLIEQLRRQSKDPESLVKVWCAVCSYKKSMESTKRNCELITERNKSLGNDIIALQKERSQVEIEKTRLQLELCNMRLTAENSELKAAIKVQAKEDGQLPRTPSEKVKEEIKNQIKLNQSLIQDLDEIKERNSELEKEITRFKNLCSMAKDSDSHKSREFTQNASSTTHRENDVVLNLRKTLESIETKLQQEIFHWQCLEDEHNHLQPKAADTTAAQEKCEMLEGGIKKLEETLLRIKTHMDKNMVEHSEIEKHKRTIEEQHRSQAMEEINKLNQFLQEEAASDQKKEQRKQDYIMSMEHRIKAMEAEMVEIKSRTISMKTELRLHKKSYRAELKTEESLEYELEKLTAENSELKAAIKVQAKEDGQLPRTPSEKVKEEIKNQIKLNQSLIQDLDEIKERNSELEKEITRFKNLCSMAKDSDSHKSREFTQNASSTTHRENDVVLNLRKTLESIETKLQQEIFHWQCLEDEHNHLQPKAADTTAAQEKCEMLEGGIKKLEETLLRIKTHMDKNMVEHSEIEKHKRTIEEQHRSQAMEEINKLNQFLQEEAASDQKKEQRKQDYIMSMEHRIKAMEAEMVEIKSRTISMKTELRLHKKSYRAELKTEESLEYELENEARGSPEVGISCQSQQHNKILS